MNEKMKERNLITLENDINPVLLLAIFPFSDSKHKNENVKSVNLKCILLYF